MERIDTDPKDELLGEIVNKINEIVDAINKLNEHYHETLDTHYNTSFPRYQDGSEKLW